MVDIHAIYIYIYIYIYGGYTRYIHIYMVDIHAIYIYIWWIYTLRLPEDF